MTGGKKVLFICVENACRSQMAEGFARSYGKEKIEVFSAGSEPRGEVDRLAIEVMKEKGIDISYQKSKGFNELKERNFDYVITMGCKDVCPFFPAKEQIEWEIPDPKGKSIEFYREVREKIELKVKEFLDYIKTS